MFQNLLKNTSKSLKRVSLSLRALIGTVATAAYIQSDVRLAFWFLVGGAVLDFVIQCLPPDTEVKTGTKTLVVLVSVALLWLAGCGTIRPVANSVLTTDSITTKYKPVDVPVKGAVVNQTINLDSLLNAWTAKYKQYLKDSTAAVASGKPIPKIPLEKPTTVTDPETKAKLSFWIDEFGKLQVNCESKDQTVQILVAENNRLQKEVRTVVDVQEKTPLWNYIIMGLLGAGLILSLIKR